MHRTTESSSFFAELLESRFEVSRLYVLPDSRHAFDWHYVAGFDVVVLWQMDFLAPLFLARGHRTVVIPMYDGSAVLPQVHWASANGASFVNFSRTLHERVRLLGLASLLVKYFPDAVAEDRLPAFDGLRVFLWQRRPEDGINADLVGRLFGEQLAALHVHNVPDNPALADRFAPPSQICGAPVTVSRWLGDRAEYYRLLERCNVFVCPRPAEGLGMAMLEAMARGLLVVANDLPSHNEYVCNWLNGVLFNTANVGSADFSAAQPVARMGWRTVREGRARWLAAIPQILDFIAQARRFVPAEPNVLAALQRDLVPAYLAGGEIYERFLLKLLPSLLNREAAPEGAAAASPGPAPRRHPFGERLPFPVAVVPSQGNATAAVSIPFANGAARPLLGAGWSVDEAFGVWIEGVQADMGFAAAIAFPVATLSLHIVALVPGESTDQTAVSVSVTVNGLATSPPLTVQGGGPRDLHCEIVLPAPLTTQAWHLEFCCDRTLSAAGDARRLSVAVIALDIGFAAAPQRAVEPAPAPSMAWRTDPADAQAGSVALDAVVRKPRVRGKPPAPAPAAARERVDRREKV